MQIKYTLGEIKKVAEMIISGMGLRRVIFLEGELGAGKTCLSAEIIKVFLKSKDLVIQSPTYSIINIYTSKTLVVAHLDLYRVKGIDELYELGLQEMLQKSLCIIEWPEIMKNFPHNLCEICHIKIVGAGDDQRCLYIE